MHTWLQAEHRCLSESENTAAAGWGMRIPEHTQEPHPAGKPRRNICALLSAQPAGSASHPQQAGPCSWCPTFPTSQTLSQSPTKLTSMEVGEPCDTDVLAAPCPHCTHRHPQQRAGWPAPTLTLFFSSEPSVRRKASWPSVPSTRRKQLVVWPIPDGRTLSQSMALITVLFPLLVLGETTVRP